MKFKHFVPLLTFIIPTVIISTVLFIVDEPPPPLQLGGFIIVLIAACGTYFMGIKKVLEETEQQSTGENTR